MILTKLFFVLLCSFTFHSSADNYCKEIFEPFFGARIIMFYAPLRSEDIRGQIVIYHHHPKFETNDKVILLENDTSQDSHTAFDYRPEKGSGIIYTGIPPLILKNDSTSKFMPRSSGYCAYWERGTVRSKQFCLTTQPQWMHLHRHILADNPLHFIHLPATHQSGSYSKKYPQSLANKFLVTQDQTVLEQLISGARYLDLRPAYKNGIYYNAHGFFFMQPMLTILYDIKEFLDNTQEIVIVSFKEFSRGFNIITHDHFLDYLETEFKDYYLNVTNARWNILLREIWETNRRLIIVYDHTLSATKNFTWPYIGQQWGNVPPEGNLKNFISVAEDDRHRPSVTMATYTLQIKDVWSGIIKHIFRRNSISIHSLAVSIGPNITQWYNELHYDTASIIAVDYIQATGIVDFCIEWNLRYSSRCTRQYIIQGIEYQRKQKKNDTLIKTTCS